MRNTLGLMSISAHTTKGTSFWCETEQFEFPCYTIPKPESERIASKKLLIKTSADPKYFSRTGKVKTMLHALAITVPLLFKWSKQIVPLPSNDAVTYFDHVRNLVTSCKVITLATSFSEPSSSRIIRGSSIAPWYSRLSMQLVK